MTNKYSFDGNGINDASDPYKPRIATFINSEAAQKHGKLMEAAPELLDSLDPDTLEAVADEIDCFEHSARAASLRGVARRQRAIIAKARA